ncbi:MAG: GIY-YIG nuclease family protein [Rubellimicrobium sp.]|nr:GIY-YIG nuclease family protein [Rubellimicrobium sp.]
MFPSPRTPRPAVRTIPSPDATPAAPPQGAAFEGNGSALRRFLATVPDDSFYTYLLLDPSGLPFYVGKGKGGRVLQHRLEALRESPLRRSNPFKCRKIRRIVESGADLLYRIDRLFAADEERACLLREEALIARHGRRSDGGSLTNLAAGLGSPSARDPFSTERHAATLSGIDPARPERTALNLFLGSLGGVDSVPIKPLGEYRSRLTAAYPSPKNLRNPSRRNALTIAAAVLAVNGQLAPDRPIARVFDYHPDPEDWPLDQPCPPRVTAVIENGAMSDILKLNLARLHPTGDPMTEALLLDRRQIAQVAALLGDQAVADWQLLAPG